MKRSTNKRFLKYSSIPMVAFILASIFLNFAPRFFSETAFIQSIPEIWWEDTISYLRTSLWGFFAWVSCIVFMFCGLGPNLYALAGTPPIRANYKRSKFQGTPQMWERLRRSNILLDDENMPASDETKKNVDN